jgi:DNA-binding Lrp family transcriptional regulator
MSELDNLDKKLLYQLDLNSRQPLSRIAKTLNRDKTYIRTRIKNLEERKIILNYYTVVDAFKLGYICLRIYIQYQYVSEQKKKEIIAYFVNNKYTWCVAAIEGDFDLAVFFWVRNINNFYGFWENTLELYGDYFHHHLLSLYIRAEFLKCAYLLDTQERPKDEQIQITGGGRQITIDSTDNRILQMIASKAQLPVGIIAQELKESAQSIRNRLKRLEALHVIKGFRVNVDISKLGYRSSKVDIFLSEYQKRKAILSYIRNNPYLYSINYTTGASHLELEFHVKEINHLHEIMTDLINKFSPWIRNYKYFFVPRKYKLMYIPEEK